MGKSVLTTPEVGGILQDERLGALLHDVARRWRGVLDSRLKPLGLSQAKWRTLFYLQMNAAPMNQKSLANLLGVEGPTLVGLLDRLGREGWLTRREDTADRRCKDVVLLPKARETARQIQSIAFDLEKELLQGISSEDLAACMRVMKALRVRMQAAAAGTERSSMKADLDAADAAPKGSRVAAWVSRLIIAAVTLAVLLGGAWYWRFHQMYAETEDAYVGAHVVQVSSQVSGPAIAVPVKNNQYVRKGALLFEIDPAPYQIAVERARAQLALAQQNTGGAGAEVLAARAQVAQMQAQLQNAISNSRRTDALVKDKFLSRQAGEDALTQQRTAQAAVRAAEAKLALAESNLGASNTSQIKLAQANLAQAELNLSYTKVYAPTDGYVTNLSLQPGTTVVAGQPQFAFVESGTYWVDANFKETDFEHIRVGQKAKVVVDMYPSHPFQGVVESLSSGSGAAFSLLPPQNATGNWVKVTQRVPVRVYILNPDQRHPLRIGTSATVTIDLRSR